MESVLISICQTGLSVEATDPLLHLVYTFKWAWIWITFASVEGPMVKGRNSKALHALLTDMTAFLVSILYNHGYGSTSSRYTRGKKFP